MITSMKNQQNGHTATITFVATNDTGITGNIMFKANNGQEERIIGHDKNVSVGMFFDLIKRLETQGFEEVKNN